MQQLVLASSSPRRVELLRGLGLAFIQVAPRIDETPLPSETAEAMVLRLAERKAEAGLRLGRQALVDGAASGLVVIAADTVVEIDGNLLGKPGSKAEGVEMLLQLSGREHRVVTGFCVADSLDSTAHPIARTVTSRVRFCTISQMEAESYWASGEPQDKAGAYGIQGLGSVFVQSVAGSYSNIVGLPLAELHQALVSFGINCLESFLEGPLEKSANDINQSVVKCGGKMPP